MIGGGIYMNLVGSFDIRPNEASCISEARMVNGDVRRKNEFKKLKNWPTLMTFRIFFLHI